MIVLKNEMIAAFRKAGIVNLQVAEALAHDRRKTIQEAECTNPIIHGLFGKWPLEFNRPEFGIFCQLVIEAKTRKKRPRDVCKITCKKMYSKKGAASAIRSAVWQLGNAPSRMYFCIHCKRFHLSSKK